MILLEISSYAAYANTSIFEGSLAWTIHLTYQEPYNLNVHLIMLKLLRDGSCGDSVAAYLLLRETAAKDLSTVTGNSICLTLPLPLTGGSLQKQN